MLNSVPTSLICTDCLHGLATNLIAFLGEDAAGVASSGAVAVCGAGFGDGKVPDSVQVTTAADTAASSSSSASRATASASPTGKSATSTSGGAPKVGKENSSVWWLALATALVLGGGAVLV